MDDSVDYRQEGTVTHADGFDLITTYVHLDDSGTATPVAVDESFWKALMEGRDGGLNAGRLVMNFEFSDDWDTWEMHPAGDEVVCLLHGSIDLVLEGVDGETTIELRKGRPCCIVPRGVWHTAKVHEPSAVLHITEGAGTQHRPLR
jgi:mannose-6-phosphate isomerase-like protein (cupin superfamily)